MFYGVIQLERKIGSLELAVEELMIKFKRMMNDYRAAGMYSPIEQVAGRVKTISSILDKAYRKGIELEDIEDKIDDIAGVRIICQFEEEIMKVVQIIHQMTDLVVVSEDDYITRPKESGYRSYHVNILYDVQTIYGHRRIKAEIQIRTLGMNFWSVIEHSLQYKYNGEIPAEIEARLIRAARAVHRVDREMSAIRGDIIDCQNAFRKDSCNVTEIMENLQNMHRAAHEEEEKGAVMEIQREFYEVYKSGDKEALRQFSRNMDRLAEERGIQKLL